MRFHFGQVKIWFQNRRMKWKRGKKASMEARAKQNSDSTKNKPETVDTLRKQEAVDRHASADSVHNNNNNNNNNNGHMTMSRADPRSLVEHGPLGSATPMVNKLAATGTGNGPIDFFSRRPTSVIAFSVPAAQQSSVSTPVATSKDDDREPCRDGGPADRKSHGMTSAYGMLSLT
jgi:hypothetical protein